MTEPTTCRRDWPAFSDACRRLGLLRPAGDESCAATIRAADLFGPDAIARPTWITVARTEHGMSTRARWIAHRWLRLTAQRRADRRRGR